MDASDVAIVKGIILEDVFINCLNLIGGIQSILTKGDNVFIKITLRNPERYPTNSNLELLKLVINECKKAGANQIFFGSFPQEGLTLRTIDNVLKIKELFEPLGAELIFLDEEISLTELKLAGSNVSIKIPSIILNCDKLIYLNQINVDPVFNYTLSLLNSLSCVAPEYQRIETPDNIDEKFLSKDQYRKEMISRIIDIYNIRKPDFVINDMFNIMEAAGPFIYKNSNLLNTGILVMGIDSLPVDFITLKLLDSDALNNELIKDTKFSNFDEINILGDKIENNLINIRHCNTDLSKIKLYGSDIKTGLHCTGCYEKAYHLLNLMKTYMTKDLKYISNQSILIGKDPEEPELLDNVILFGDCAISSTEDYAFRKIEVTKEVVSLLDNIKKSIGKHDDVNVRTKNVKKNNKKILSLKGCPPNQSQCIKQIIKYHKKHIVPNLFFYDKVIETYASKNKRRSD